MLGMTRWAAAADLFAILAEINIKLNNIEKKLQHK